MAQYVNLFPIHSSCLRHHQTNLLKNQGTKVGDPIEVEALSRVFRHKSGKPALIGSIKTNLGHSEAVSGISSIIKAVLALEHGVIPPTIGIKELNPALKLSERNVKVVTKCTPWPAPDLRRVSVNSFGYGGANSHAIIESAAAHVPDNYGQSDGDIGRKGKFTLLNFSGSSKAALLGRVEDISLLNFDEISLSDLAFTLASHRSALTHRGFTLIENDNLHSCLNTGDLQTVDYDRQTVKQPVVFVFTGQGAQWPRMGRELFAAFPVYRQAIQELDSHLAQLENHPTWTIEGIKSGYVFSHSLTICYRSADGTAGN